MILGSAVSKISQALADMRANSESDDRQRREIRLQLGECPHLWKADLSMLYEVGYCGEVIGG